MLNNGNDQNQNDTSTTDFTGTGPARINRQDDLETTLLEAMERISQLEKQVLQAQARGTGDVTEQAARAREAAAPTPVLVEELPPLSVRIEQALRGRPMSSDELARVLHVQVAKVLHEIKVAKQAKHIYNIGQPDYPRWFWRVGPQATPKAVQEAVSKIISDVPMSFAQICVATGIKGSLVQGALIELRRTRNVVNLGSKSRARYFMMPETVIDAKLDPKAPKTKSS